VSTVSNFGLAEVVGATPVEGVSPLLNSQTIESYNALLAKTSELVKAEGEKNTQIQKLQGQLDEKEAALKLVQDSFRSVAAIAGKEVRTLGIE
jgi:hypothetical protein